MNKIETAIFRTKQIIDNKYKEKYGLDAEIYTYEHILSILEKIQLDTNVLNTEFTITVDNSNLNTTTNI
jgi:hypothetical protein